MAISQVDPLDIRWKSFTESELVGNYDRKRDVLYICQRSAQHEPAVSLDIDGDFWLRIDPKTGDVVGIEIEDFRTIFLEKFPEVAHIWKQVGGFRPRPEHKQSILSLLVERLKELFRSNPHQLRLA